MEPSPHCSFPETPVVLAAARRYFERGRKEHSLRLLAAAIAAHPEDESLWLARLEILSGAGTSGPFLASVRDFLEVHLESPRFPEVVRLWKRLPAA